MLPRVFIQTADFDLSAEVARLREHDKGVGAVCSLIGTVRDRNSAPSPLAARGSLRLEGAVSPWGGPAAGQSAPTLPAARGSLPPEGAVSPWGGPAAKPEGLEVVAMELEHYPGMTEKAIEAMIDEAHQRFNILGARVVHRVGLLRPLDQIVLVAVSSSHRGQSFQACEFLMDYLKTQAPFWKKEQTPQGARWVDARVSDDAALAKWGIHSQNA